MNGGGGKNGGGAPGRKPCGRNGGIIIGAGGKLFVLFGDSTRIGDGTEFIVSFMMPGRPSVDEKMVSNLGRREGMETY